MAEGANSALITFGLYTIAVLMLAVLSSRVSKGKDFVDEYFLGSRSFGLWAFALTFAATNSSGGSFMGFPALIYTHGWSLTLWISGFMLSPLIGMALIGKRLNQVARISNALTIPEILSHRFASRNVGLVATLMLVFFLFFYLLAQFKAGGKILSTLLSGEPLFQDAVASVGNIASTIPWVNQAEPDYLLCLLVFSLAVIVYVVYGGFRAVVWTDVMQGVVMLVGVVVMLFLALNQVGGLSNATRQMAEMTPPEHGTATLSITTRLDDDLVIPKGSWIKRDGNAYRIAEQTQINAGMLTGNEAKILKLTTPFEIAKVQSDSALDLVKITNIDTTAYRYGANQKGVYLHTPGPSHKSDIGFLVIGSAISFFVFWPFGGAGQPSNMVRLMSFKDTRTLRYSVVTVAIFYTIIYVALVLVFCCGRVLMPGMEIDPDRTMPDLATTLTQNAGMPWLAGLLVAAPFAAVMSSVDSFLLMVSSSVVRDIYQGNVNPNASEVKLKRLSYGVTIIVGLAAMVVVLNPPLYLQDLIVFASGGLAACFLIPVLLSLYWRRMTAAGAIAGMIGGMLVHLALTCWGYYEQQEFRAYEFLGLNPFLWDLVGSALGAVGVSLIGIPNAKQVQEYFYQSVTE